MFDRLESLESEYEQVLAQLSDPAVLSDSKKLVEVTKRHKELEPLISAFRAYRAAQGDIEAAKEMMADVSGDDRELLHEEISQNEARMTELEDQLKILLLPKDPFDDRNVIFEIRGAEGGEEANLFAKDLFEMYQHFAERMGWKIEVLNTDVTGLGGFNDITFSVKGDSVWSRMKHEGGPHRVQRVPVTESSGRIHTSSATVTVLPEAEEVDVEINPNDLQIDVYRSSGPGGQSVNTTDSAVRITHKPTGIVVSMQDERSQLQNRARAMTVLRAKLLQAEIERQNAEISGMRKGQVGGGGRSEKIRTYNFKDNRVTDHRIGLTLYNKLDRVLAGELDEIIDALIADERAHQLSAEE
jgi:peptide chain release factor 1